MKHKLLIILSLLDVLTIGTSYADGILSEPPSLSSWRPVIGAAGGIAVSTNLGQYQAFPIQNPVTDEYYNYSPNSRTQTQGMFEVFLGVERAIISTWLLQGGLAYSQTGSYQAKGSFIQGADASSSDQYTYQYNVTARTLFAEAKLMRPYHDKFYPYLLGGIGGSFNKASNFSTNVSPFLTFTRSYQNHTSSAFAYKVGVGIDMDVVQHARLGLTYRFSGLGRADLGSATINGTAVSATLNQSSLFANEILIQLTYVV